MEQSKFQFHFLDTAADLAAYALLILPDTIPVDVDLGDRLRKYLYQIVQLQAGAANAHETW